MNYYMLHELLNDDYIYVNPNNVVYYIYDRESVDISLTSGSTLVVDKKDFEKMMNMEGVGEYWLILLLTVYPSIIKLKLSY